MYFFVVTNLDQSRMRRSEHMFNDSHEGFRKSQDCFSSNKGIGEDYRPDNTAYSFSSNNHTASGYHKKASTTPLKSHKTPNQNHTTEARGANSDYGSRSRSKSGYRKIDNSPIEVNTSFELSQKNTQNLWKEYP